MNVELVEIDQVWQSETTNYWFSVDGESVAVSDTNGDLTLLDSEGHEDCGWDAAQTLIALGPHYIAARDNA